jgi:pilus assembly protein FimV
MATMHRWKYSALAAAAVASFGLYSSNALALALGPITVQSALGEPLRAEIELVQISPSEAETLRVTTATPETFRAQGMEYSPVVTRVQIEMRKRPNGSTVLRLSSDRPVNEPFVDLVVDANWNTGRLTRSYTMLFDPPTLRKAPVEVVAKPEMAPARPAGSAPERSAPVRSAPVVSTPVPTGEQTVTVKPGDTAGRIANANRPADVSLDQMLVAILRANPDAFIQGNVNRIRAGAVLQLPGQAETGAISKGEARQIIAAQSRDFNDFRRKLAGAAPAADVGAAGRSASGTVQAQVQDQRPTSAAPDKLTLSKGAVKGQKATEEELARRKQSQQAAARVEELSKNISELNKLGTASASVGAAPAPAASAPGVAVPVPAPAASPETAAPVASEAEAPASVATPVAPASDAASAPEASASEATATAAPASEPASAPAKPRVAVPVPPPAPVEEPGFLSELMEDPMIPLAGGGLLALLLGFGAWRVIQRRRAGAGMDSSFLESRLQPDSFFGASGGQRVDTANTDSTTGGSSMAYSPSQLDAGGDVDPVAEADVYLAYGRDLQAEEILKEAVRHNPTRVSIHAKLAEIYAKRQDRKALESVASEIHQLTQGEGPDWNRVAELGRSLDAENPLYQPGGRPAGASALAAGAMAGAAAATPPDLDLDLDLDLPDDALTEAPPAPAGAFAAAAQSVQHPVLEDSAPAPLEIPDYDSPAAAPAWQPPAATQPMPVAAANPLDVPLDVPLDLPAIDTQPTELDKPVAKPYTPSDSGLMEFDLDSISLDLKTPAADSTAAVPMDEPTTASGDLADDPLATKLALAQEFNTIGDSDGARTLIEEVIAEASGDLKARAQKLLSELG